MEIWKGLLTLFKDAATLALVLGVALVILADSRWVGIGSFRLPLVGSPVARAVFLALGSVLALGGLALLAARSVRVPRLPSHAIQRAGLSIEYPHERQEIFGQFDAHGRFKKRPRGRDVRAFVASTSDERIWPQGSVIFDDHAGTWSCRINLWEEPRPDAYVFVAELGEAGTLLCDYYGTVGRAARWIPVRQLPADAVELARVRVQNGYKG